ncbi:MAG: PadR family transcriptional regulator [Candidatus Heimdallarchaeota archaeon]|nr:PadR family transcriptional regulator [Candidatus Heimdallarchaeota archaeon]
MQSVSIIFDKWKSRWVSSVLEVFILFMISVKERYGGELVSLSQEFVDENTKVPTVYAIIKRYTGSGVLKEFKTDEKSGITRGKSRIYYRLSDDGQELIDKIKEHINTKLFLQTLNFEKFKENLK